MRRGRRLSGLFLVSASLIAGGCGGSSHKTTTGNAGTPPNGGATAPPGSPGKLPANAPAALKDLRDRVLRSNDLPGFAPQSGRVLGVSAREWIQASEPEAPPREKARNTAALERLGFVSAVQERLAQPDGGGAEAISIVERFKTASAARAQLSEQVARLVAEGGSSFFPVPAIPTARGIAVTGTRFSGENIAFYEGAYYYLVGSGAPAGSALPSRGNLARAASRLYTRVHG